MTKIRRILKFYGGLFCIGGISFVFGHVPLTRLLNWFSGYLPGAAPIAGAETSLWLGLAGALMASITYLAFSLAENPNQDAAWNALLLSKAVSTVLFTFFALIHRNTLFLLGTMVDAAVFLHLSWLRNRFSLQEERLFASRLRPGQGPFYEVWFAKLNDPKTSNALWVRYTLSRSAAGDEAACWYILFDHRDCKVLKGRWQAPLRELRQDQDHPFRLGESWIAPGRLQGKGNSASWVLSWEKTSAPPFHFTLGLLTGFLPSGYVTPVSLAKFSGQAVIDGRIYIFDNASGSIGHLWGKRMADSWRWAHAAFEGKEGGTDSVFEILSARIPLWRWTAPLITCAHLWHEGRHYASLGLRTGLSNMSVRTGERWKFGVDFGPVRVEGEAEPAANLTAELDYVSPDGRRLRCRNSKTGFIQLTLTEANEQPAARLEAKESAAVEYVEGVS